MWHRSLAFSLLLLQGSYFFSPLQPIKLHKAKKTTCNILHVAIVIFVFLRSRIFDINRRLCNIHLDYIKACFCLFLPHPILIVNRVFCSQSRRPVVLQTKHDDRLETSTVPAQRLAFALTIRTSKLARTFYVWVNNTGFRCVSITTKPCYRPSNRRFGSIEHVGGHRYRRLDLFLSMIFRFQNKIFNLIGASSTLSTSITIADEFRRIELKPRR